MNRRTRQMGSFASMFRLPTVLGISLIILYFAYACGKDDVTGSSSFSM